VTGGLLGDDAVSALGRYLHRRDIEVRRGHGVPWAARLGAGPQTWRVVCGSAREIGGAIEAYVAERGDAPRT
jgi:hypothetical protein